jgi:hypothetical protein
MRDDKKPTAVDIEENKQGRQDTAAAKVLAKALKVDENLLITQKLNEIAQLLWMHEDTSEEKTHARIVRAVELYETRALNPRMAPRACWRCRWWARMQPPSNACAARLCSTSRSRGGTWPSNMHIN